MQKEISRPCDLLDGNGLLVDPGWARKPYWRYDRKKIRAPWYRIKEWDYYLVLSHDKEYGIALTMADLGYMGLAAMAWLDFKDKRVTQLDAMKPFTRGRLGFPETSDRGALSFESKKINLEYRVSGDERTITVDAAGFVSHKGEKGIAGSIILYCDPSMDSMAIATSWKENRKAFYYNHKINCMPARGIITLGKNQYHFNPDTDFGCLDWGRGNWTYRNRWYWGSASGLHDKNTFGFNIGYGFSDRTPASENLIIHKGRAHKLDEIAFHMDTANYMNPWSFTSNDGRFEMDFKPLIDRYSSTNLLILKSIQHQVFGYFSGSVILDDGEKLIVKNLLGFAEDVINWW